MFLTILSTMINFPLVMVLIRCLPGKRSYGFDKSSFSRAMVMKPHVVWPSVFENLQGLLIVDTHTTDISVISSS